MDHGRVCNALLHRHIIPTALDMPEVAVQALVEIPEPGAPSEQRVSASRRRFLRRRRWWRAIRDAPASSCAEPPVRPPGHRAAPRHGASARGDEDAMTTDVAVYLQDAHPIRQGMEIARYAESKGFPCHLAGREPAWCGRRRFPWPPSRGSQTTSRWASGVVNNWTRNPALLASTFSTLDDLAARASHPSGIGACGKPLARKVGVRPREAAPGDAGDGPKPCGRCWQTRQSPTKVSSSPRRRRARLRLPGAPAERGPIYIGATGNVDDGARRRDRRRCGAQYLVSPAYNDRAHRAPGDRCTPRPAGRRATSTAHSSSCARSTTTAALPSTPPGCSSRSTLGQQPTS